MLKYLMLFFNVDVFAMVGRATFCICHMIDRTIKSLVLIPVVKAKQCNQDYQDCILQLLMSMCLLSLLEDQ